MAVIKHCRVSASGDRSVWKWDANGGFSAHSYYRFWYFGGTVVSYSSMWILQISLKVKFLIWLITKENINISIVILISEI